MDFGIDEPRDGLGYFDVNSQRIDPATWADLRQQTTHRRIGFDECVNGAVRVATTWGGVNLRPFAETDESRIFETRILGGAYEDQLTHYDTLAGARGGPHPGGR
jgi:hypothetical protein